MRPLNSLWCCLWTSIFRPSKNAPQFPPSRFPCCRACRRFSPPTKRCVDGVAPQELSTPWALAYFVERALLAPRRGLEPLLPT